MVALRNSRDSRDPLNPETNNGSRLQEAAAESTEVDIAARLRELRNTLIPLKRKELQLLMAEERFLRLFQAVGPVEEPAEESI